MAKTLDELLKENPNLVFSQADLDMGRDQPGMLEKIAYGKTNWGKAETQEDKDYWNKWTNMQRMQNGGYDGGSDGLQGKYTPQYHRPEPAAQNDNVAALYDKFNNLYGKQNAPTWTPQYQEQISDILNQLQNKEAFSYNMNTDPLYQQYRDQYVREGQKAMRDSAAQTAALTGGYGSTYGAIAAQQGFDNYLAGLNDVVPQLEQQAYGKWTDELADLYNQMGAYQSEENRLYGQYLDDLGQYNADRDYAFNAMQAAIGQNNYENEFNRGIFESDREFNMADRQNAIDLALKTGDYSVLKDMGIDLGYLNLAKDLDIAQMQAQMGKLQGAVSGGSGNGGPKPPQEEELANQVGDGWIYVSGYGRVTDDELDAMVKDGRVKKIKNGNKVLYRKA